MKLQTRLSLLLTILIILTGTTTGYFSIATSYSSQLDTSDQIISEAIKELSTSKDNPLSLSTYLADTSSLKFSVAFITEDFDLIPLNEGNSEISNPPNKLVVTNALSKALTFEQSRIRAYQFSEGEYILLYYSLAEFNESRSKSIGLIIIFTSIIIFISALITFLLFRSDNQLNSLVNSLRKNQERMQEFIGDASHELRTPLTVIRGYFDLFVKNRSNDIQNEIYQKRIESEILRMQSIIDNLLLIAELEEQTPSVLSESNISNFVQAMIDDLRLLQPNREISYIVEPNLNINVSNFHLTQVLANISSNISRHTPPDSFVKFHLFNAGPEVKLTIEDSGSGLPSIFYENGIQAFRRFDTSRSRESGGSGLGMTIIEKIVRKNQGNIKLSSSLYGGLKTEITF